MNAIEQLKSMNRESCDGFEITVCITYNSASPTDWQWSAIKYASKLKNDYEEPEVLRKFDEKKPYGEYWNLIADWTAAYLESYPDTGFWFI